MPVRDNINRTNKKAVVLRLLKVVLLLRVTMDFFSAVKRLGTTSVKTDSFTNLWLTRLMHGYLDGCPTPCIPLLPAQGNDHFK